MYTMVLMMAATSGGDAPAFGRGGFLGGNSCNCTGMVATAPVSSCTGTVVASGCTGAAAAPTYSGCTGTTVSTGCTGCTGCTGGSGLFGLRGRLFSGHGFCGSRRASTSCCGSTPVVTTPSCGCCGTAPVTMGGCVPTTGAVGGTVTMTPADMPKADPAKKDEPKKEEKKQD